MPIHVHLLAACVVEDVEVVPVCVIGATKDASSDKTLEIF